MQCIGKVDTIERKLGRHCTRFFMTNAERYAARYKRRKAKREEKQLNFNKPFDDYNNINNPEKLFEAFYKCKQGVSWKHSVQNYEQYLINNISKISNQLGGDVLPSRGFQEFNINERGKIRHIRSPHISERVVQKALCDNVMVPILSRVLIYDNGANLRGKGTSFSRKRIIAHMADYRRHYGTKGYALVIDYSKYFDNIDHDMLFKQLFRYIKDPHIRKIIYQSVIEFGDVGLGLGSQISQISSVFFPNPIDHFIKEKLRIKYYGRYMDDSYLIHSDKDYLKYCLSQIKQICHSFNIKLNPKKTKIVSLSQGIPFLKCRYTFGSKGRVMRCGGRESTVRMHRKLKKYKEKLDNGEMELVDICNLYKSWKYDFIKYDSKVLLNNIDAYFYSLFKRRI